LFSAEGLSALSQWLAINVMDRAMQASKKKKKKKKKKKHEAEEQE
jgi:hypothetical protein